MRSGPRSGGSFRPPHPAPAAAAAAQAPSPQSGAPGAAPRRRAGRRAGGHFAAPRGAAPPGAGRAPSLTAAGTAKQPTQHRRDAASPTGAAGGGAAPPRPSPPASGAGAALARWGRRLPKFWGHVGRGVGRRWAQLVPQTLREPRRARSLLAVAMAPAEILSGKIVSAYVARGRLPALPAMRPALGRAAQRRAGGFLGRGKPVGPRGFCPAGCPRREGSRCCWGRAPRDCVLPAGGRGLWWALLGLCPHRAGLKTL